MATTKKAAGKKVTKGKATAKKAVKKTVQKAVASPASKAQKLNKKELEQLRELLFMMRDRMSGQAAALRGESLKRDDEQFDEEDGTDAFDRQFALSLANSEIESVKEIDEALRRIQDGTYGSCGECGVPIAKARLKALPFGKLCIQCQSDLEKRNGNHRLSHLTI